MSQRTLAARIGRSQTQVSRIETGLFTAARIDDLGRQAAALGLRLTIRAWPVGQAVRDQAQIALLGRFRTRCSPTWGVRLEVSIPGSGDLRAWDMVLTGHGIRIGVEAVTRLRDIQALLRAVHGKQRDSGVDRVLVVVSATHANRRSLAAAGRELQDVGARTRSVLAALAGGRDPGQDAWLLL